MKSNLYLFMFIAAIFLTITSCTHEWKDPSTSLPNQSISIADLISSRDAYDSAGVSLIGKVWDLKINSTKSTDDSAMEEAYTTFILADRMGTGVDVYAQGEVPIAEGDFVRVVGVYRKEFQPTGDYFLNVVDAVRIEEWSPGFKYWIREFEFD